MELPSSPARFCGFSLTLCTFVFCTLHKCIVSAKFSGAETMPITRKNHLFYQVAEAIHPAHHVAVR